MTTSASLETTLASILRDHFDNAQNPHETIYRIWLMLNANGIVERGAAVDDSDRIAGARYN